MVLKRNRVSLSLQSLLMVTCGNFSCKQRFALSRRLPHGPRAKVPTQAIAAMPCLLQDGTGSLRKPKEQAKQLLASRFPRLRGSSSRTQWRPPDRSQHCSGQHLFNCLAPTHGLKDPALCHALRASFCECPESTQYSAMAMGFGSNCHAMVV